MNITDPTASNQPMIGLIELPDLAETLTRCGVRVVTGPDFRSAATAIRAELTTSGAFPMVVADIPAPGLRAWVERIQQTAQKQGAPIAAAVLRNTGNPIIVSPNVTELVGPFTVNQLLTALSIPVIGNPEGSVVYPEPADVKSNSKGAGLDLPDFDDFFDDEQFETPANAVNTSSPATAPVIDSPEESFGISSAIREAAAPIRDEWDVPAPAAAPAPVLDDWDTPAPAADASRALADWDMPAPAAPAAAAPALDDWDTPASAYAPAPAQAAEPLSVPEWDTPAPVLAPLPVSHAPAPVPSMEDWELATPVLAPLPSRPAPSESHDIPAATPARVQPQTRREARAMAEAAGNRDSAPHIPAPAPEMYQAPAQRAVPRYDPEELDTWQPPADLDFAPELPYAAQPVEELQQVRDAWNADRVPLRDRYDVEDASAIFDNFEASKLAGTGRSAAGLASFVINFSGKGGVGKSTSSLQMAHLAAAGGLRVILIDGNSGQGDLRTYLRLNRTTLPTIYDAAIRGIRSAVLTPDIINQNREDVLGHVNFAFIGAPPDDINDPSVVTNQLYSDVISFARRNADLVILDTQIIETNDRTGVVSQILLPALVHDAWGMGITDMSNTGVNNLNSRLRTFIANGVPQDRLMIMVNKVYPEQETVAATMPKYFSGVGGYLGTVAADLNVQQDMNAGRINVQNQDLRTLMGKALLRITGNEAFLADAEYTAPEPSQRGLFAKIFGKKSA